MEMSYHLYYHLANKAATLGPEATPLFHDPQTKEPCCPAPQPVVMLLASKANSLCCSFTPSKIQVAVRVWHTRRPLASSHRGKLSQAFPRQSNKAQ